MSREHFIFRRVLKLATPAQTSKTDSGMIKLREPLAIFKYPVPAPDTMFQIAASLTMVLAWMESVQYQSNC